MEKENEIATQLSSNESKQNFDLFLQAGAFYGLKNKKIYNDNNSYFILWWLI